MAVEFVFFADSRKFTIQLCDCGKDILHDCYGSSANDLAILKNRHAIAGNCHIFLLGMVIKSHQVSDVRFAGFQYFNHAGLGNHIGDRLSDSLFPRNTKETGIGFIQINNGCIFIYNDKIWKSFQGV